MKQRITPIVLALASIVALAACSAGGTSGPSINSVNPTSPSYSSLQFAVGTANVYGNPQIGLNVVSTFRQNDGRSATGVNTPTLTGPFTISAPAVSSAGAPDAYSTVLNGGPSYSERSVTAATIGGTPQTIAPGTPNCDVAGSSAPAGFVLCQGGIPPNATTFGESGGVFAMGIAPYNAVAETGQAYSYAPYAQPFYDASALPPAGHVSFVPWGGPPAFDPDGTGMGERDGVGAINGFDNFNDPYFLGVAEGITAFDGVAPGTGTYTLNVAVATVGSGGSVTTSNVAKQAALRSLAPLPTMTAPVVTPDANGDGGATFTASLPPGVTEAYVQIVDYGPGGGPNNGAASKPANCQGPRGTAFAPVYYTFHITNPASTLYALPKTIGPNLSQGGGIGNLQPSPSLCTSAQNTAAAGTATPADDYVVQTIGFDYPVYQAALSLTQKPTPENPPIAGASGQSDITISIPMEQDAGGAPVPLSRHVRSAGRRVRR